MNMYMCMTVMTYAKAGKRVSLVGTENGYGGRSIQVGRGIFLNGKSAVRSVSEGQ